MRALPTDGLDPRVGDLPTVTEVEVCETAELGDPAQPCVRDPTTVANGGADIKGCKRDALLRESAQSCAAELLVEVVRRRRGGVEEP